MKAAKASVSPHTIRSVATTGVAVLGGRWRIDWPRTNLGTCPGENWNIVPQLPCPDVNS